MDSSLNVVHFIKKEGVALPESSLHQIIDHAVYFETCLRKIWIVNGSVDLNIQELQNHPQVEILKDDQAYHFLLEVMCGLKSPVVGETEVFGQFKNQVFKKLSPKHPLFKVITGLVTDTKNIRYRHLTNLGSSSYGSLARKYLAGFKSLDILGAGEFVQSLKPWIEKLDIHTHVYTRAPENYTKVYETSKWSLRLLSEFSPELSEAPKALFICAPIDLRSYDLTAYDLIMDFRDMSQVDDLNAIKLSTKKADSEELTSNSVSSTVENAIKLKRLNEIFEEIEKGNLLAEQKKSEALVSIQHATQSYISTMNHRPFGWDDLSA